MIKEQINVKDVVPDRERDLAAHKGEAPTELEQQVAQMNQQTSFELTLLESVPKVRKSKL